jgi:glycosyltransferase involved in cell wall biosynthesis
MAAMPLRVLIANDTYPPQLNGAAVFTQRLARGLAGRGHQVAVIGPGAGFQDAVEEELPTDGGGRLTVYRLRSVPVRPIHPYFRMLWPLGVESKTDRIIRRFQPQVIHIQNHFILGKNCLRAARRRGIPILGTNHFMPQNLFEFIPDPLQPGLARVMWRDCLGVYNRLDLVTAPSQAGRRMLLELGLTAPSEVISNGMDLARYRRRSVPESLYQKYGICRDRPVFLAVGRLERDKNVHLILQATAQLVRQTPVQAVLVGQGRDQGEFQALARRLGLDHGTAVFTGALPEEDLACVYSMAQVYIGAGEAELQGLAVMEAMAAGLPVLAANAVALPELVRDGENGLLFSLTAQDLAEQMRRMLARRDEWPAMGARSLERIQPHDAQQVLARFEELYRELMGKGG